MRVVEKGCKMNSVKGIFLKNESMANHTSWRCGGNAAFFEPRVYKTWQFF